MTLMSQLGILESAGLIRVAQIEPDVQYLFRHALVQDAAYASLLDTDQQRLHRAVGHAVEALYPDRLNEYAPMLARHFREAGEYRHAVNYFSRAGITALTAYANEEAESHFRSALKLGCEGAPPSCAALLAGLGEALFRQSRYDEAVATWGEAIEHHRAAGDLRGVARLYARSARATWHTGNYAAALDLCLEGLRAVEEAPESAELAALIHEAGRAYYFGRQPEEARPLCERALAMAERLGAVAVQADTLATLGVLPDALPDEAIANLRRAVELASAASGDDRSRETWMRSHHNLDFLLAAQGNTGLLEISVRSHHNLGTMLKGTAGDLDAATRHLLRAAELARQRGAASEEIYSLSVAIGLILDRGDMGQVEQLMRRMEALVSSIPQTGATAFIFPSVQATLLQRRGDWEEALQLRRQAYAATHRQGDFQGMVESATDLAWTLVEMERLGEFNGEEAAMAALDEAATLLQAIIENREGTQEISPWSHCLLAIVRTRQGKIGEARQLLDTASEQEGGKLKAWHEMALAEAAGHIAAAEARWDEAAASFQRLAELTEQKEQEWYQAYGLEEWASVLIARGTPEDLQQAQRLLQRARTLFEQRAASYYVALVRRRLAQIRSRTQEQAMALGAMTRELAVAGRIQEGLLPQETPYLPGWQLAATLEPARETSGDFYDFVRLGERLLGIVIADVADKGAGAALYMALTRTLLRTYAAARPTRSPGYEEAEGRGRPAAVLQAVNERILSETRTDMFVTLFYAVIEADSGTMVYANAGHNPPFVLRAGAEPVRSPELLRPTGMALGVISDSTWHEGRVELGVGDALVLYTDGAIDARRADGEAFGQTRLLAAAQKALGGSAQEIENGILDEIHRFVGNMPRFDDLTLMVIARR